MPLSTTRQPENHDKTRPWGITSMAMSADTGRLYSLCRDGGVYVYATSHLILGHAPALSTPTAGNEDKPVGSLQQEGLGPIYCFRHPKLWVPSFYVKLGLRRAQDDQAELLATGSVDGNALLFPTDQRQLGQPTTLVKPTTIHPERSPGFRGHRNFRDYMLSDRCPVYWNHGTHLTNGHETEVSCVCWTVEGNLITIGDDYVARCWRQERPRASPRDLTARECRARGEDDPEASQYGWAVVDDEEIDAME